MEPLLWLIVSWEQGAFWRPQGAGYTMLVEEAGRYTEAEARDICEQANQFHDDPRRPNEVMVLAPEALRR